jgi:hypothetical protein
VQDAVLRSFALGDRTMKRDAKIGAGLHHLLVSRRTCNVAEPLPVGKVWFGTDSQVAAG